MASPPAPPPPCFPGCECPVVHQLRLRLRTEAPALLAAPRRSAVACLLRQDDATHALSLLFIRRAATPGDPWAGDVAWPGGRAAPGEVELQAAMRETLEEVGVNLCAPGWQLLGPLDDTPAVEKRGRPHLVVRPFVFLLPAAGTDGSEGSATAVALAPRPAEVAAAWWVPLAALRRPPRPLPTFPVAVERLGTRLPALRSPRVRAAARALGLAHAVFPFLPLPPPPPPPPPAQQQQQQQRNDDEEEKEAKGQRRQQHQLPPGPGPDERLWGVTLRCCELLCAACDGEARALRGTHAWRLGSPLWEALRRALGAVGSQSRL